MAELTVAEMEQYVRAAWRDVWCARLYDGDDPPVLVGYRVYDQGGAGNPLGKEGANRAEAWQAAYAFTKAREEEIRQIDEEIMLLRSMVILLSSERGDRTAPVYKRTIARLQAISAARAFTMRPLKADLQRGMSAQTKEATDAK